MSIISLRLIYISSMVIFWVINILVYINIVNIMTLCIYLAWHILSRELILCLRDLIAIRSNILLWSCGRVWCTHLLVIVILWLWLEVLWLLKTLLVSHWNRFLSLSILSLLLILRVVNVLSNIYCVNFMTLSCYLTWHILSSELILCLRSLVTIT